MRVEVAVVPAAGRATRLRPATRCVPKALLPVVDRPVIQWLVEEGMRAGVRQFVVVLGPGADDPLRRHFEGGEGLDQLEGFSALGLSYVVQEEPRGLGDAVLRAREAVAGRPFFCLLGDNLAMPGRDPLAALAAACDGRSVVALRPLADDALDRYGVARVGARLSAELVEVAGAVEKPGPAAAPSRLGFVGRYLFTPEVFDHLAGLAPGCGGEIQLTDAIDYLGRAGRCLGRVADEDLLDVGTPGGYLEAVTTLGLAHPTVGPRYRAFLEALLEGP